MSEAKAKVLFNSACPVCRAGVARQRADMEACGLQLEWIDIHRDPDAAADTGSSVEEIRERLHVVDEHGRLHVGADAFAELWQRTPKHRLLARGMRLPGLRRVFHWMYDVFARRLYRWNRRKGHW